MPVTLRHGGKPNQSRPRLPASTEYSSSTRPVTPPYVGHFAAQVGVPGLLGRASDRRSGTDRRSGGVCGPSGRPPPAGRAPHGHLNK
eukprot:1177365-Prorocentrum_minimum.AAC.1